MRVHALPALAVRAAVALVVVLLPVAAAGPAAAGGPTSVLLSAPALGRTASLYASDSQYAALSAYVGAAAAPGSADASRSSPRGHAIGDFVSVTWLIHDVTIWRVDRIYVDAPGGPWIASQVSMGEDTGALMPERAAPAVSHSGTADGYDITWVVAAGLAGFVAGGAGTALAGVAARRRAVVRSWEVENPVPVDMDVLTSDAPTAGVR